MRVLALSDLHCGHMVGLTPPEWQYHPRAKELQSHLWTWFAQKVEELKPIDVLLFTGDATEGKGGRAGGVELIEPDMSTQARMAARCLEEVGANKIVSVHGTPYHEDGGDGTDWGAEVASLIGAEIRSHAWVDIEGVMFDIKHKVGSSGIPHGRSTALNKEALWNLIWSSTEEANPKSDVILRGHVHYHQHTGDPNFLAMSLPALQGPGSKYGERQCSGVVHFGITHFDVKNGGYDWKAQTLKFRQAAAEPIRC